MTIRETDLRVRNIDRGVIKACRVQPDRDGDAKRAADQSTGVITFGGVLPTARTSS